MRIITNAYLGKKVTGIGRYFLEIIDNILELEDDFEILIYTNYDNNVLVDHNFNSNKVKVVCYNVSKNSPIGNLLYNAFVFPVVVLKHKADLIYIPNFTLLLVKVKPTVSVIYDTIEFKIKNKFSMLRTAYRYLSVPRMAKLSDHIITISESSSNDIMDLFDVPSQKITIAPCAVSENFVVTKNQAPALKANYILYVGTVDHPGKNVFNTIKAFDLFKQATGSDMKFVVCGMPGKGFETVSAAMKESPYADDIIYKGYVSDEELFNLYSHAEMFVFTSRYEGFGLPVLEAMRYGLPVITSNKSSLPEVAGDAAVICDPDSVAEIAAGMSRIATEPAFRSELVEKGYANLRRYSWSESAQKTISVFHQVRGSYSPN